ncbi:MAG: hypothetical protein KME17_08205 [Cyanosarcina radialis HA8281-LM2]|jgi:hypothetical protein|nr:hypothetical protein [Cyanosarcina radialis HA8281-LM2]
MPFYQVTLTSEPFIVGASSESEAITEVLDRIEDDSLYQIEEVDDSEVKIELKKIKEVADEK